MRHHLQPCAFSAPAPLHPRLPAAQPLSVRPPRCSAHRDSEREQQHRAQQPPTARRHFLQRSAVAAAGVLSTPLLQPLLHPSSFSFPSSSPSSPLDQLHVLWSSQFAAHALSKKRILAKAGPEVVLADSGIVYRDITIGKGYVPRDGDTVAIHYSLFYKDLEVESSRESQGLAASPIGFTFGATSGPGAIMQGINLGMDGMKVGGLRLITVPPKLAYGEKGKMPLVPPNSTVDFAVSLLSCKRAGTNPNSMINPKAQAY